MAQLQSLVYMRGVLTCFGHPLFTMMTGLGVAFGLASRSKIVRVVAPVTGYLLAAFLHMFFNLWASVLDEADLIPVLMIGVWPIIIVIGIRLAVVSVRQGRIVAARLQDYVTMGWLPADYPAAFSRIRTRLATILMSLWHANVITTWQLQVRVTRLALLREEITRGTVDQAGVFAERELIGEISALAARGGLVTGKGLRPYWPWRRLRYKARLASSSRGSAQWDEVRNPTLSYSVVDARWGPPT